MELDIKEEESTRYLDKVREKLKNHPVKMISDFTEND